MSWAPTSRLLAYPWLVASLLLAALATGRPELAAAAAPIAAVLLAGLLRSRRPGLPAVRVTASASRVVEGDVLDLGLDIDVPAEIEALEVGVLLSPGIEVVEAANPAVLTRAGGPRQSLTVPLRPERWGSYSVGTVHLRGFDDFRLRRFQARVRADVVVRAYPGTERLRTLIRPLHTHVYAGSRVAAQKGEGIEFADLRPYVSGDRVRSVNWRASARRSELWVNQRHPERNVGVVLLLDTFVHAGPVGHGTLEQMVRGASSLASAWLRDHDRVGLIGFGGTLRWLEVGDGPRHAYRLIDAFLDTQVVLSYAWKGVDVIPIRLLPPHALIVGITPLLDRRMVTALFDLHGRGCDVAAVELRPDAHVAVPSSEVEALARRIWRLEREAQRARLLQGGIGVASWTEGEPLEPVLMEVEGWRRRARLRIR
ncbi:MAG: DUF58 domain-containing protein [Candidatus Dormibacteria bacterium]|jgi:uncharacterized protein (DUF58 family)